MNTNHLAMGYSEVGKNTLALREVLNFIQEKDI